MWNEAIDQIVLYVITNLDRKDLSIYWEQKDRKKKKLA